MTVINSLVFNPKSGAIVSDEQSSTAGRKENTGKKIFSLYDKAPLHALIGEAGPVCANLKAISDSQENPKNAKTFEEVANHVAQTTTNQRIDALKNNLYGKFGFTYEEALRGKTSNDIDIQPNIYQAFMNEFSQGVQSQEYIGQFIVMGKDEDTPLQIACYNSCNPNLHRMYQGHFSIGSGADASNLELSKFMNDIPRDKRNDIDPVKGLEILLYATHLSGIMNHGVGGTPDIGIIHNGKIIQPKEYESHLAAEIARANKKGSLIRPEFSYEAICSLLLKGENYETIEGAFWKEAESQGSAKDLSLFLRGYRV